MNKLLKSLTRLDLELETNKAALRLMAEELVKVDDNPYSASEDWADMEIDGIIEYFRNKHIEKNNG